MLLGAFKLAMTFVAVSFVDTAGRRPLLLAGVSTMVAALVALGGLSVATGGVGAVDPALAWGSVAALLLYVGAYQVRVPAFALCPLGPWGSLSAGLGGGGAAAAAVCGFWLLVQALFSHSLVSGPVVPEAHAKRPSTWERKKPSVSVERGSLSLSITRPRCHFGKAFGSA